MRKWLIVLSVLLTSTVSGAPAWRWVDSDGTVHYSDRPVPGATQIELGGAQTFSAPPRTPAVSASTATSARESSRYETFEISSPAEQQTLWNIGATLQVQLQLSPSLAPNHRIDLIYDGRPLELRSTSTTFTLTDVFRGTHTLQAVIRDLQGTEVQRSPLRSFIVQQTSILNPNAPLARPPRTGRN
jgi:hypothetical protein